STNGPLAARQVMEICAPRKAAAIHHHARTRLEARGSALALARTSGEITVPIGSVLHRQTARMAAGIGSSVPPLYLTREAGGAGCRPDDVQSEPGVCVWLPVPADLSQAGLF